MLWDTVKAGDGLQQHPRIANEQHQPHHEQHMVDAEDQVFDADDQVAQRRRGLIGQVEGRALGPQQVVAAFPVRSIDAHHDIR